jgi:hypothetical protein
MEGSEVPLGDNSDSAQGIPNVWEVNKSLLVKGIPEEKGYHLGEDTEDTKIFLCGLTLTWRKLSLLELKTAFTKQKDFLRETSTLGMSC